MHQKSCSERRICLIFASLIVSTFICSCTTMSSRYLPTPINVSEPPLNSINVTQIGDNLLRQGTYLEQEAIYVRSDIDVGTFNGYTILSGFYVKEGDNEDSDFFRPSTYGNGGSVIRGALVDEWNWVQAYKTRYTICIVTVFNVSICRDDAPFERTKQPVTTPNSFQQTLIYTGKLGNKLRIGYREFSGSFARPAFNNDVEYDLNESNIIGYKGARIEVLEATNEYIKYKVLKNFTPAAQ
jgi:hypothetical protein